MVFLCSLVNAKILNMHNIASEALGDLINNSLTKTKNKKMKNKTSKQSLNTPVAETNTPAITDMKPKPGNAPASGVGVGRGGPKTSPTDGRSLKPSGGKGNMKKGGKTKK